ncbi:MAG: class I SAM-dependent methyltransferase [Ruminiclostridium sp.]
MEILSFIKQYIIKPRTVGAVLPSSKYLANKMIEEIDFSNAECIVEYGPGTGVFTEKLIANRNMDTVIILFESNKEFSKMLERKYKNQPKLYIINDSAQHIDKYLTHYSIQEVDYIVSGLPFASLPHDVSAAILVETKKYLKQNGKFITFQYTSLKIKLIQNYFKKVDIKMEARNIPPAFVLCCGN